MAAGSSSMRSVMGPEATRGKERALPPSNPRIAHEAHRIDDPRAELAINRKAAARLKIEVPPDLLKAAAKVY